VRLLSYNVGSLRGDRQAVAWAIRACAPDVVCVQESPRALRWRSRCAALARESGLLVVTGGRTAGGALLLAALRVDVLDRCDIRRPRLALATVSVGGERYTVASSQLAADPDRCREQVDQVLVVLSRYPDPVLLAADGNEAAGRRPLTAVFQEAHGVFVDRRLEVLSSELPDVPGVRTGARHRPVLVEVRPT
jgi:endonuclease/exonuclease/phosphatase family metal-dependent hydrolase